jgi:DnaK suppressor protein
MNKKDLRRYEDRLTAMRDRLTSEVTRMIDTVRSTSNAAGEHDRVVSESLRKELALEGAEEGLRCEVVAALARIDEGRFGMCQACTRAIAKTRLEAVPYAALCIGCEHKAEAGNPREFMAEYGYAIQPHF